jgi:menaquinone-specific isochorismate synthase
VTLTHPFSTGLVSRTRHAAVGDVLDILGRGGFAWLHDGAGLATAGVAARIPVGPGPERFRTAAAAVAEVLAGVDVDDPLHLPGTGPLAVGAIPFADDVAGELVVPALVVGRTTEGRAWITETGPAVDDDVADQIATPGAPIHLARGNGRGRRAWTDAAEQALAEIARGPLAKVVLARELVVDADRPFRRRAVLDALRADHPSSFTYAAGGFVGASPELLVRRRGGRVLSRPMAGTTRRGATPADDERLVAALLSSPKESEEHALVVGAVRAALETVCRDVIAAARPEAVRLSSVTHLATSVAGHLDADGSGTSQPLRSGHAGQPLRSGHAGRPLRSGHAGRPCALTLAGLLHPTPAVAGLPRPEALAAIARLESFERGLYAGPVGWVDARGDGDWAVALRCASLDGSRARLAAGAGIVADSEPDDEWAETEAKLEPMLAALQAG